MSWGNRGVALGVDVGHRGWWEKESRDFSIPGAQVYPIVERLAAVEALEVVGENGVDAVEHGVGPAGVCGSHHRDRLHSHAALQPCVCNPRVCELGAGHSIRSRVDRGSGRGASSRATSSGAVRSDAQAPAPARGPVRHRRRLPRRPVRFRTRNGAGTAQLCHVRPSSPERKHGTTDTREQATPIGSGLPTTAPWSTPAAERRRHWPMPFVRPSRPLASQTSL